MIETALVFTVDHDVLLHHAPDGASSVSLPDSRTLWDVMWTHRDRLGGVAHTHPGSGEPHPSREDVTTFAACEAGLGRRLDWWIATSDRATLFRWSGPGKYDYRAVEAPHPPWLDQLRHNSWRAE